MTTGKYNIMGEMNGTSEAWFLSHTKMLDDILPDIKITWSPDGFVRLSSTIYCAENACLYEGAFNSMLIEIANSGLKIVDDKVIDEAFGHVIDESKINAKELHEEFNQTLRSKYGKESTVERVIDSMPKKNQLKGSIQLMKEILEANQKKMMVAEKERDEALKKTKVAEEELKKVAKYRKKLEDRKSRNKKKKAKKRHKK